MGLTAAGEARQPPWVFEGSHPPAAAAATAAAAGLDESSELDESSDLHPTGVVAPLVALLKVFLGQQALFKGGEGGIGSYRLYVLVSAFLDARQ